ncbi:enoyl-CoA hydratase/isomerase family protein [Hyphobacterium sp.]|uniref:enoyl-CoA hydratase/isomerase family protein n=1 Tax=Hyphobacterium sp. TaxID=2004662 RepID=UPI003BAB400D
MATPFLSLEQDGPVATLVIDRPSHKNALNEAMWAALPELAESAATNAATRLLVVRGFGGAFSAGADISEFQDVYGTPDRAAAYSAKIASALDALAKFPLPSLAAIDGACIGGGCGLAIACDFRIATSRSVFGITPAKLGLAYPLNDMRRLISTIGRSAAKDLLFTGRLVDASEAHELGLANRIVADHELPSSVREWTGQLLKASSNTARITKQMIRLIDSGLVDEIPESRQLFLEAFQSADFARGYRAFLQKQSFDFSDEGSR